MTVTIKAEDSVEIRMMSDAAPQPSEADEADEAAAVGKPTDISAAVETLKRLGFELRQEAGDSIFYLIMTGQKGGVS